MPPEVMPSLVSEAVWQAAQRTATRNHVRRDVARFPLSGRLFCGCGTPLAGNAHKSGTDHLILYYRCSAGRRGTATCPPSGKGNTFYSVTATNAAARHALEATLRDRSVLARLMTQQPQAEVRRALELRRDALINLHLEGLIDRAEFVRRRDEVQRQLAELTPLVSTPLAPDLSALADGVALLDRDEYQQLLRDLDVQFKVKGTHVEVCALSVPQTD